MKIAIIAEKPSVAHEIAKIVGAGNKKDGYIEGNGYMVTWAFGHLVELALPEEYGIKGFKKENLPIIPEHFKLKPRQVKVEKGYKDDPSALKQLNVIKEVFSQCDKIIVATDAGREGELIFRYIYYFIGGNKPYQRLWISSLTDKAIRNGLSNLKEGSEYNNLYLAAKARSESDWLVGINSSQALTIAAEQGTYSLGRVQTPTLAMICTRYLANKNFVSSPFWQVNIQTEKDNVSFKVISKDKYEDIEKAKNLYQLLKKGVDIRVASVDKKETKQAPPLLYDLTTLQKEANSKYGFSAEKTLNIAQKLYEAKYTTYPRTGSRYLSDDVFAEIPDLLKSIYNHPDFGKYAQSLVSLNNHSVDNAKITDHHAIIITDNQATTLEKDESIIYEMIIGRMLEAFSEVCIKDVTTVTLITQENEFIAKGSIIKNIGWRAVYNNQETDEEDSVVLPSVEKDNLLPIKNVELLEKQTKPKPLHTEASLLATMENAGKELENEEQRKALKNCGIGTPATRASIIETLFRRKYIVRDKKSLIPTEKGLAVFEIVKDKKIADVELTGLWEEALSKIETGQVQANDFQERIEAFTRQITEELLNVDIQVEDEHKVLCPKCKQSNVLFYPKVVKCKDKNCELLIFRNKNGVFLSDRLISELLVSGKTSVIKGFISKDDKRFDAALTLTPDFKLSFSFSDKKVKKRK